MEIVDIDIEFIFIVVVLIIINIIILSLYCLFALNNDVIYYGFVCLFGNLCDK